MKKGQATKLRGQVRSQVQLGNEGDAAGPATGDRGLPAEPRHASAKLLLGKLGKIERRGERERKPAQIDSFADFLEQQARVKADSGYVPYHFKGREALRPIVERLDLILASGEADASLAICGGAQFGKTVLMLNLLAYLVAVRFRNVGYYLPDDDLVSGLVDGKLRPDVLDQIPWLARLLAVGKTLNASGRAVNRKGAFLCTDGKRTALAFMRGLGKIPTSFSMDVVVQDEKDDLPEEHARFLSGRMTASNLRLSLSIGTQRYHGAGQNLAFTEGTQHIGLLACPGCGERVNPETAWPGVCRLVVEGRDSAEWPRLGGEGHFLGNLELRTKNLELGTGSWDRFLSWREASGGSLELRTKNLEVRTENAELGTGSWDRSLLLREAFGGNLELRTKNLELRTEDAELGTGSWVADSCALRASQGQAGRLTLPTAAAAFGFPIAYAPGQSYALCCPGCGALLDRENPQWHALAPEREAQRRWSFRLSQLLIPAIDLGQIVAAWQLAIRDPEHMTVFCTDRLALPKSTTQTLTPGVLEAARGEYHLEVRTKNLEVGEDLELRTKNLELRAGEGLELRT